MKRTKKFASLLLALVMVLSMSMTAFATSGGGETPESQNQGTVTTEKGSITIKNAVVGQKYEVYQILYLESYHVDRNGEGTIIDGQYAYKATEAWKNFINRTGIEGKANIKGNYVNVDGQGYVTWIQDADQVAFAKEAQKYAEENNISPQGSVDVTSENEEETTKEVSLNNLNLGYYLLDSTMGTLCSLDTTNPDVEIQEKNEQPTSDKKVEEDSTTVYGDRNDADIGQLVNFQSTITAKEGAENFVFHDEMSAGLTFVEVTGIKKITPTAQTGENQETETTATTTDLTKGEDKDYEVKTDNLDKNCTFHVVFNQTFCDTLKDGDKIVISYTATVNKKAVIGGDGNTNKCRLGYGDPNHTRFTADSITKTYTWKVDAFKYTEEGEGENKTEVPLAGAKFTLSKSDAGSFPINLIKITDGSAEDPKTADVYRVAKTDESGITEIITNATGKFTIQGLDSDTYYLTETAAPAGYNKLAGPVTITIENTGKINATTENTDGVSEVKILNQTGPELPSTGGMGTRIFYVVGGILVLGAVVLLIAKRRMNAEK